MLPLLLWALGTASAGDAPTYALKPDGGEASCFAYTVVRDGQPLTDLPAELKDALGCVWAMSLNGNRWVRRLSTKLRFAFSWSAFIGKNGFAYAGCAPPIQMWMSTWTR